VRSGGWVVVIAEENIGTPDPEFAFSALRNGVSVWGHEAYFLIRERWTVGAETVVPLFLVYFQYSYHETGLEEAHLHMCHRTRLT